MKARSQVGWLCSWMFRRKSAEMDVELEISGNSLTSELMDVKDTNNIFFKVANYCNWKNIAFHSQTQQTPKPDAQEPELDPPKMANKQICQMGLGGHRFHMQPKDLSSIQSNLVEANRFPPSYVAFGLYNAVGGSLCDSQLKENCYSWECWECRSISNAI